MTVRPLTIKHHTYPCNLVQGPLAGVSCAPFRALVWEWSKPAFVYTEMISCKTLIHQSKKSQQRFVAKASNEGPVCFQLSANNARELAEGVKLATEYGADLIDLNCGCPVKKIRSKGSGSHLLSDASKIYTFIQAMKQHTDKPISIKIRVDANSDDRFNQDVANAITEGGADFVTVHGRHWTHGYDVSCFYDDIAFFVNALSIPVIGNGDIADVESLRKMFATGCHGAMICRAGVGQPWLIEKLSAEMQQQTYIIPSNEIIGKIFLQHLTQLCDLLGNEKFAILQGRTFAKYYARTLSNKQDFCEVFNQCEDLESAREIIERYLNRCHHRVSGDRGNIVMT